MAARAQAGSGRYRYTLSRTWGDLWSTHRTVLWVMLNPSTADEESDDPTIRRCAGFAKAWGAEGMAVVNLYGLRATDPEGLHEAPDPVGRSNNAAIEVAVRALDGERGDAVVYAWGADPGPVAHRWRVVDRIVRAAGVPPRCLGTTAAGWPRHPLYVAGGTEAVPWQAPG